jgi:hypothetical protein
MPQLKTLHPEAVSRALEKALRYRLLNEPMEAESICRDVLEVEPDHQEALTTLILSLTDQLGRHRQGVLGELKTLVPRLADEYARRYYRGLVWERQGKAHYRQGGPGCGHGAFECLARAMQEFEAAEEVRPPGNEDALLRWNACARFIERTTDIVPAPEEARQPFLE